MKNLHSLYLFISIMLITGLACSVLGGSTGGEEPSVVQQEPTQQSAATLVPPPATKIPTEIPTEAPPPEAEAFFTEEFDENANWSYFAVDGSTSKILDEDKPGMSININNSLLAIDLDTENLWVYLLYDPYLYESVRLDTSVNNRGANNNNVSLICRYTESGWYEFNIANNGLYWILSASVDSSGIVGYNLIYNGGSNDIKPGKGTNEYAAVCDGTTLSLFINGKEARTVTDTDYSSGQVGVSVSSFDVLPVNVDFDWVKISEP